MTPDSKHPTDNQEPNEALTTSQDVAPETTYKASEVTTQEATQASAEKPQQNTPGVLIMQWLTYAFWGWLIIGLIWLISVILANAITGADVSGIVPYAIAATIVMLPIAFATDLFYRKHEPVTKSGAATVIMVIHAVIFALLGIGALIVSVFTGLNALINIESSNDAVTVVVLSSLFATLVYAAAFVRTLNPFKKPLGARVYAFTMLGVAALLLVLSVAGPVITSMTTYNDRLIEKNLDAVQYAVENYTEENGKLPAELGQVTIYNDVAEKLVQDGKVHYIPGEKETSRVKLSNTYYRYQLCVTYDRENNERENYASYDRHNNNYALYMTMTPHDAGEVCYKLKASAPNTDPAIVE